MQPVMKISQGYIGAYFKMLNESKNILSVIELKTEQDP